MLFQQNGTSLWYGTPDASAPHDAILAPSSGRATGLAVTVGVRPIGARTSVEVRYRVNGGAGLKVQATLARTDIFGGVQYFVAGLPEFRVGDKVDYIAVAVFPGSQVPNAAEASNYPSSFHVEPASPQPLPASAHVMAAVKLPLMPTFIPKALPNLAGLHLPLAVGPLEWVLTGKLVSAVNGSQSFSGCRIEAFVDCLAPNLPPATESHTGSVLPALASAVRLGIQTLVHPSATAGSAPAERVPFRASALSDAAGAFALTFPAREQIAGQSVRFMVSSPVGRVIAEKELSAAQIGNSVVIDVQQFAPTTLPKPTAPAPTTTRRVRGRLIERSGKQLPASIQVLLLGREQGAAKCDSLLPVLVAKADSSGYFSGDVPNSKFDLVVAVVGGVSGDSPIRLEDGLVPASVPLVVELPSKSNGAGHDGCQCSQPSIPRTPTQENITESPGTYSADLGTGQCIHFNVPNRAIEEYNFFSVVRTTQPDIVGLTTGAPIRSAPIQCLPAGVAPYTTGSLPSYSNPVGAPPPPPVHSATPVAPPPPPPVHGASPVSPPPPAPGHSHGAAPVSSPPPPAGVSAPAAVAASGPTRGIVVPAPPPSAVAAHAPTASMVSELETHAIPAIAMANPISVYAATALRPDVYANRGVPRPPGRVPLDWRAPVDWDSTPTFYEAASIAHGHLLHFKQVWYADGYSLGDLLYSLPLAPGQKKLISVVDWERREQTTRAEDTTAGESLQANLQRDRDVNEVVGGTLSESSRGGSRNTTVGVGAGTGGAGNGSYEGFNFGALLGVSGGYGESDSSAFQDSSRNVSSSSLQNLRDRTLQSASAIRNLRSTLVQTARQGEAVRATTEVVANHNHCHALTIQYFEVLRHLKVTHELADVQECLFVPLPMSEFDRAKSLRWRQPLSTYLQRRELAQAFDATRRVETCWTEVDTPPGRYADELVSAIFGEITLTIFIPLPPIPEKPKPDPAQTATDTAAAVAKSLNPTEGFLGAVLAVATGGVSLLAGAATSVATDVAKATTQGARAMAESLYNEESPEERYKRFQQEVMPAAAAGFVDQLELYALVGANEVNLSGADFTLVSEYQPGTPMLVSVRGRMTTPISRADISALIVKSSTPLPPGCRAIVNSASLRYQTRRFRHDMVNDSRVNDDIDLPLVAYSEPDPKFRPPSLLPGFPSRWVPISGMTPIRAGKGAILYTPLDEWEQRAPRIEDIRLSAELLDHLNTNLEYYHHAIWWTMDPNRRYMLLDGYVAPNAEGRSVASVVDNTLVGIVGNALILPVAPGNHLDPQFKLEDGVSLLEHYAPQSPAPPSRVSLPTRGVFAEAIMGDCNACEEIDDSRFWRWEESPIDEPPALDASAIASRRSEPNFGTPTPFPSPIVSIQNAPAAPDPTGVKAALDTLTKQSFTDITGLAGTQANAAAAYSKAVDTALQYGKEASTLAQQAAMLKSLDKTMGTIDKQEKGNKIDSAKAQDLRVTALKKAIGDTSPKGVDTAEIQKRLNIISDTDKASGLENHVAKSLNRDVLRQLTADGESAPSSSNAVSDFVALQGDRVQKYKVTGADGSGEVELALADTSTQRVAPTHIRGLSGLGDDSGDGTTTTTQLWSGAKSVFEAVADGIADWKNAPNKELSDAVLESLKSAAIAAADQATDDIPLVKAMKVGVELSLAFANGVGDALNRTNAKLRATYNANDFLASGSDGLTDADYAAIQNVRRWQQNSLNQLNGILLSGIEAVGEELLNKGLSWLSSTAIGAVNSVTKQLVGNYLQQSGAQAILASGLSELSKGIPVGRSAFYKEVVTTVLGLYVRQLDNPGLRKDLAPLTKLGANKPTEKMLLTALTSLIVENRLTRSLGTAFRKTLIAKAKALVDNLRASGQSVTAGKSIDANDSGVVLPSPALAEIERGADAAQAEIDTEVDEFRAALDQLSSGAVTLANSLGRMKQRALVDANAQDDEESKSTLYNSYIDDFKGVFRDFYKGSSALLADVTDSARSQAELWQGAGMVLPRLMYSDPSRWERVKYVIKTDGTELYIVLQQNLNPATSA